jgi:hypothetical protein
MGRILRGYSQKTHQDRRIGNYEDIFNRFPIERHIFSALELHQSVQELDAITFSHLFSSNMKTVPFGQGQSSVASPSERPKGFLAIYSFSRS